MSRMQSTSRNILDDLDSVRGFSFEYKARSYKGEASRSERPRIDPSFLSVRGPMPGLNGASTWASPILREMELPSKTALGILTTPVVC